MPEKRKPIFFVNADKTIKVEFNLNNNKTPIYKVFFKNKLVLNTSDLGVVMEDANFFSDLTIEKFQRANV